LFLVDNASQDGSVEYVTQHHPQVQIIQNKENLGPAEGYNAGLRFLNNEYKYVVLVNNDMAFDPQWLSEMVKVAENDPSIGACQPKILQLSNPKMFEYNGACGGFLDAYGYPWLRGRIMEYIEEDRGQYDNIEEIFWVGGCSFFIRKEVLDKTGLFDDMFFIQFEEIDLCWRIHLCGYRVFSVPSSVVYHKGTQDRKNERVWMLKHRNNILMIIKNYSFSNLSRNLPLRFFLDLCSLTKTGTIPLRAYSWILRNLRKAWKHRLWVQTIVRSVPDESFSDTMIKQPVPIMCYLKGYRDFRNFQRVCLKWKKEDV
jgi:GT2 family glycosyltransferase